MMVKFISVAEIIAVVVITAIQGVPHIQTIIIHSVQNKKLREILQNKKKYQDCPPFLSMIY